MSVDLDSIEHLDFELSQEAAPKCEGMLVSLRSVSDPIEDIFCDEPAAILAIRACCGHADVLCLSCYNAHIESVISSHRRNKNRPCKHCYNSRPFPPYSSTATI